ncbi:MAG TPA: hypothetical protein HPP59_03225 [Deltaproteobacteria bacterium]|nr:hypothetical protein [Deltaproteobacteria bacterium]
MNSPEDMVDQFPHAPEAIANTIRVAESSFTDWNFLENLFPPFEELDGELAFRRLYKDTMEGCQKRYGEITHDVRDRVIDYAFAKYGNGRTAMVANHNGFGLRSAIREVAKIFGLTDGEISQVTKKIGFGLRLKDSWQELSENPRMKGMEFKKPWDEILSTAFKLQGHFNHLSTHCGGLVIVPDEIRKYCPVEIANKGLQVLQAPFRKLHHGGLQIRLSEGPLSC